MAAGTDFVTELEQQERGLCVAGDTTYVCMYVCMYYVRMYVCMHVCTHVRMYYVCMYVRTYVTNTDSG